MLSGPRSGFAKGWGEGAAFRGKIVLAQQNSPGNKNLPGVGKDNTH